MSMSKYDIARESIMHLITGAVSVEVDMKINGVLDSLLFKMHN